MSKLLETYEITFQDNSLGKVNILERYESGFMSYKIGDIETGKTYYVDKLNVVYHEDDLGNYITVGAFNPNPILETKDDAAKYLELMSKAKERLVKQRAHLAVMSKRFPDNETYPEVIQILNEIIEILTP